MFKNTCFVTLMKLFLITAIMLFALMASLLMCVLKVTLLSSQIPKFFFQLHFFNVFAIDFIDSLQIQFIGSYCHVNTFVDIKRQNNLQVSMKISNKTKL